MGQLQIKAPLILLGLFFSLVSMAGEVETPANSPVKVLFKEAPHYPQLAQKVGFEGIIVLSVPVDSSGRIGQPVVVDPSSKSPSSHILSKAAVWAAKRSKFKPAMENGGPVASAIELTYEFVCPRDSLGNPVIEPAIVQPPRRHTFQVPCDQICLYGHWISGEVEVLQIESRVYVGGIRVYLPLYTKEIRSRFSDADLLKELITECNWLQRDLLILEKPWEYVECEIFRLILEYPAKVECEELGEGRYRIRIGKEETEFTVLKKCPPFDYNEKQERVYLGKAEGNFFGWLSQINSGGMVLMTHFITSSLGRNNPRANAIEQHLEECRANGTRPVFSSLELEKLDLLSGTENMLREPEWVFRR